MNNFQINESEFNLEFLDKNLLDKAYEILNEISLLLEEQKKISFTSHLGNQEEEDNDKEDENENDIDEEELKEIKPKFFIPK